MISELAGGATAAQVTEHESLDVAVKPSVGADGVLIAQRSLVRDL